MTTPKILPELRAMQKIIDVLEPFTQVEQERIVQVAVHMMGYRWANSYLGNAKARRLLTAAQAAIKKVS